MKKLRLTRLTALCLLGGLSLSLRLEAAVAKKPNIVFILLDDLDKVTSESYFKEVLPSFEKLKKEGVSFSNAFAPTSLCCPARATILTGKYAHNTGVLENSGPQGGHAAFVKYKNEEATIAVALQKAGYRTAAFGKYLNGYGRNGYTEVPSGWSVWHAFAKGTYYKGYNYSVLEFEEGRGAPALHYYGYRAADYSTDVLREKALNFIDSSTFINSSAREGARQPFFVFLNPTAPHGPLAAPPRYEEVAEKWFGTLPHDRPNFYREEDIDGKPSWLYRSWDMRLAKQRKAENNWYKRMGSLYAVDDMIESIVAKLKSKGLWDETILIISSDNGFSLGAHAILGKKVPYEESIRVPLLVAGGAKLELRQGETDDRYVLHCDYAPTFRDLAGLPVDPKMDGQSFLPLLNSSRNEVSWRSDFLLEYTSNPHPERSIMDYEFMQDEDDFFRTPELVGSLRLPSYAGLRGSAKLQDGPTAGPKEFAYVEWYDPSHVDEQGQMVTEYELYNISDDPYQLKNLLHRQARAYKDLRKKFHARLVELKGCSGKGCF